MPGFTGGCMCGAIRYEAKSDPVRTQICHCDDCRGFSGASFATNVFVRADDLEITQGTPKQFQRTSDTGNTISMEFCGDCGSRLLNYNTARAEFRALSVGSLDDPSIAHPEAEVFTSRALHFTNFLPDTEKFETRRAPPARG